MAPTKRNASAVEDARDVSSTKKALIESSGHGASERIEEAVDDASDVSSSDEEDIAEQKASTRKAGVGAQDIQIARETAELFKSNIFKMQIDELQEQVKLKESHILRVEKFLHRLYDLLQGVPEWEGHSLAEVDAFFKGKAVCVPFCDPKPASSTPYKFGYKTPSVALIGSFALKTAIYQPQGSSIDVLLTMPEELFEKKDFLNFRCVHKRSVYLAYLTYQLSLALKKNKLEFLHLEYAYLNSDPLQPMLRISCNEASDSEYNFHKTKFSVNLIVGFPYGVFEPKKLLPTRNCIRVGEDNSTPTPFYNFSVLSSSTHEHYLKYLYKTKKQTEAFREACVLGRLWLAQRGFHSDMSHAASLGGFGNFEFAILMAVLLNGGGVNGNKILLHGFSSYQMFKGIMKYLATMDLCSDGYLQFHSDLDSVSNVPTSKYVEEGFRTPTLFDKTTKVNILSKMSVSGYHMLKLHAQQTLAMLNDVVRDQFASIFLTKLDKIPSVSYDLSYDLEFPSEEELLSKFGPLEKVRFISFEEFFVNKIANVIRIALGDRIRAEELELVGHKTKFPIHRRKPAGPMNFSSIKIKLLVNPIESEKLVTKGPANTEEQTAEAAEFTSFWGKKASLRRFKDGSIIHSCVWSTSSNEPVIMSILNYVLKLHISADVKLSNAITRQFHSRLPQPNLPGSSKLSVLNSTSFHQLKRSFDNLYKIMFQLKLPLSVKSILPVGAAFRYATMCQPVPYAYSNPEFLQEVILEFETSPKWPDEISALEKAKTAFLLKIQEQLTAQQGDKYRCYFARDESIPYNLDIVTLNILTPEGYGFKVRVLTERDEVMYLRAISNARNELKQELEKTFLKFTSKYQASIRHTRTLELLSHSFPFYSPVVRLFKQWLDSHLLLGHLPEELVELIAIKPFVEPYPYAVPGSIENGFLRVLKFLSEWNWKEDPLILDLVRPEDFDDLETSIGASDLDSRTMKKLSERLTLQQYKTIQANFRSLRNGDPHGMQLQFFVASKNDPSGILYSSSVPLPIATRLTALAKVAVNLIQLHGLNTQSINLLFTPALKDYDFTIRIRSPTPLRLSSGVLSPDGFKNLDEQPTQFPKDLSTLPEKMDCTYQIVKYLNMKYKNSILFSSHLHVGVHGGPRGDENVITGLIRPAFKSPFKFKVNMDCNARPIDPETVKLNSDAVFREIATFGKELVVSFESS
ncbi:AaceriADR029Wp [[Ashbya] aceris (nom. inval.)]|nr:AaceriADR029Wp [[Ashbya] aceris (nom. inval.)]